MSTLLGHVQCDSTDSMERIERARDRALPESPIGFELDRTVVIEEGAVRQTLQNYRIVHSPKLAVPEARAHFEQLLDAVLTPARPGDVPALRILGLTPDAGPLLDAKFNLKPDFVG